jgi:hypothetical protein
VSGPFPLNARSATKNTGVMPAEEASIGHNGPVGSVSRRLTGRLKTPSAQRFGSLSHAKSCFGFGQEVGHFDTNLFRAPPQ